MGFEAFDLCLFSGAAVLLLVVMVLSRMPVMMLLRGSSCTMHTQRFSYYALPALLH